MSLVQVRGLTKTFASRGGRIQALRGVDLSIEKNEIVGLVGESGCGKSTLGRCILRLEDPDAGQILLEGTDITTLSQRRLRPWRRKMQLVFQDPFASLNPRQTVEAIVTEPLVVQGLLRGREPRHQRARELLQQVGLSADACRRLPHEFSGGQRQRISIARALAARPSLIVADEPTSSLDSTVQLQVVQLLLQLQKEHQLSYLLISHNLRLVLQMAQRAAVMYLGRIVETAPADRLRQTQLHPYTQALWASQLNPTPGAGLPPSLLVGEAPSPLAPPTGCAFHPRCPLYRQRRGAACTEENPQLGTVDPGHQVACHEVGADRRR